MKQDKIKKVLEVIHGLAKPDSAKSQDNDLVNLGIRLGKIQAIADETLSRIEEGAD